MFIITRGTHSTWAGNPKIIFAIVMAHFLLRIFMFRSVSQKPSKIFASNLVCLFTNTRGTHSTWADNPKINFAMIMALFRLWIFSVDWDGFHYTIKHLKSGARCPRTVLLVLSTVKDHKNILTTCPASFREFMVIFWLWSTAVPITKISHLLKIFAENWRFPIPVM